MFFVYQPEGAQPQEWEFEPNKLMSPEAEAIERNTGMTYQEWTQRVGEGSVLALHGLLYVMLKRSEPTLKWENVQFCMDDVDFKLDEQETAEAIVKLQGNPERTPAQEQLLQNLLAAQEDPDDAPKGGPSLVETESSEGAA